MSGCIISIVLVISKQCMHHVLLQILVCEVAWVGFTD